MSIQYLRAVAALAVVGAHTHFGFGEEGVDIFFVISGFVMMHVMVSSPSRAPVQFFLDRYFRIAPLYYFFTLLAVLIGLAEVEVVHEVIQALTFIKYYKTAPLLETGWTLEYEFIFYGLCAVSIAGFAEIKARVIFILSTLLISVIVIDFIIFPEKKYAHFCEFGFGIVSYFIYRNHRFPCGHRQLGIFMMVLALLGFCVANIIYSDNFYYMRFIGFGIPSFILVISVLTLNESLPRNGLFEYLGNASYSIYLSHLLTLHVVQSLSGIKVGSVAGVDMLFFLTAVLVGSAVYSFVEIPMTRSIKYMRRVKLDG